MGDVQKVTIDEFAQLTLLSCHDNNKMSFIYFHSPSSLTSSDLWRTNIGPNNLASKERAPTSCQQNILSKKYCWRKLWAIQISWEVREKCFHPKQSGNKWKWKLEVSWTHIPLWPLLRTLRPVSLRYPLFQRLKNPRFEGGVRGGKSEQEKINVNQGCTSCG